MSVLHCYCTTGDTASLTWSLQCGECQKLFHLDCLKSGKPSPLEGDLLFKFVCVNCSLNDTEQVTRMNLHWTHVVQLTMYNLHLLGGGKCGYFRWREHICSFIDKHWTSFFGFSKKKTTTWNGTVAGTLSSGCPHLFVSGASELGELGWWKLADPHPPLRQELELALSNGGVRSTKKIAKKSKIKAGVLECPEVFESTSRRCKGRFQAMVNQELSTENDKPALQEDSLLLDIPQSSFYFDDGANNLLPDEDSLTLSDFERDDLKIDSGSVSPVSLSSMTMGKIISDACVSSREAIEDEQSDTSMDEREAQVEDLSTSLDDTSTEPVKEHSDFQGDEPDVAGKGEDYCIIPIGKYREKQLLQQLENNLSNAVAHNPVAKRLKRKLIVRQLKRNRNMPLFDLDEKVCVDADTKKLKLPQLLGMESRLGLEYRVLDRYQVNTSYILEEKFINVPFITRLIGREEESQDLIISPYTARVLKPYIWKDVESKPMKLRLLEEITQHYAKRNPGWQAPPSAPISYCYVQPHQIPSINVLCQEFFWQGIDLSESLQYPDFSCVALYKKVVIGFAFMVPDVKYNEAYISFVFTHPDWRNAGIATFMLYHLIQTCMGKDVTLHVSATNPALLLYQKFGFKVEEFIVDFYDKYFAEDSHECRHAMFLRLSR